MKSTIGVTILALLNLLLSFLAQIVVAFTFGASADLDAFVTASTIPLLLSTVVSGSLTYALMPQLVHIQMTDSNEALMRFVSAVLILSAVFFGGIALMIAILSEEIIRLTNPGFSNDLVSSAAFLLRIQSPIIVFVAINAILISYHQAHRKYGRIALAPVILPLILLVFVSFTGDVWGVQTLAYATLIGYAVQLFMLRLPGVRLVAPREAVRMEAVKTLIRNMKPLFGGSIVFKTDALVDRFFASQLGSGPISHLWYSRKIIDASTTMLATGISTTSFTRLSEYSTRDDEPMMAKKLLEVLQILGFFAVPFTLFLCVYASEIIQILLERGLFLASDTTQVGILLVAQSGVLVGGSFGLILANAFYSLQDTRTPTIISLITYPFGVALKVWWFAVWGVAGVAAAMSVYVVTNCVILLIMLRRRFFKGHVRRLAVFLIKICLVAAIAVLVAQQLVVIDALADVVRLILVGAVYILLYLALSAALRLEPIRLIYMNYTQWRRS